jgi:hypothetical protein
LTGSGKCVLRVIDLSFAAEQSLPVVRLNWISNTSNTVSTALNGLPALATKTARIYIHVIPSLNHDPNNHDRTSSPRRKLYQHLETVLGRRRVDRIPHGIEDAFKAGMLFNPVILRSQWSEGASEGTYGIRNMSVNETSVDLTFPYSPASRVTEFHSFIRCMPLGEDRLIGI